MTNGTKIALLVGGLVVVGGGIAFALTRKKSVPVSPVSQAPEEKTEPVQAPEKKKKGALLPVLGGLFVAGGTYLALKKKDKTGDAFTMEETDTYGYV